MNKNPQVLIIIASDSDLAVMSDAAKVLEEYGVSFEMTISSAHRSPDRSVKLVEDAHRKGVKVIIAAASLAAHLAGAVAAHFPLPVIGVPLKAGVLNGQDAFLATLQMPPGVPVATVAIDGAKNAGLLAVQILATSDKNLEEKLVENKKKMAKSVEEKGIKLEQKGWQNYSKE